MPLLTRIHADYHLGQVLIAPDGYRVIDFEGEPFRHARRASGPTVAAARRRLDAPLDRPRRAKRGPSARGRATAVRSRPPGSTSPAWLRRARERFLDAYRAGLREAGAPIVVDPELIRAFEIEKECYEFIYASTYLPSWIWAPTEGMRGLFEGTAT